MMLESIGAMIMYGIWAFALERMSKTMNPMMLMAFTSIGWFIIDPIQGLIYWKLGKIQNSTLSPTFHTYLWFILVVITTSIGTGLLTISMKRDSQVISTVIPSAYPIIALILGVIFANKSFKLTDWIGTLCVVIGIILIAIKN